MARPTDGNTARDVTCSLRLTAAESALIEKRRGTSSRSEYIRSIIALQSVMPEPGYLHVDAR